jgi:hypothetical protein
MTDDHEPSDQSIEEINGAFAAIEYAEGNRWTLSTLHEDRLHLSRGSRGEYTLFLEGERPSFGNYGWLRSATYEPDAVDLRSGRDFHALRITAPVSGFGNRAIAHIAYEFVHLLATAPEMGNEALLLQTGWILELLGDSSELLSPERELGLTGECVLLWRLLQVGHAHGIECGVVLERWRGESRDRRDFAAEGISIEVKTSAQLARVHHISSLSQLEPLAANERVYLYSLGIRRERLHDRKLPTFVDEVEALLVSASGSPDAQAIERFRSKLRSYGYDPAQREAYEYGPGLMLNENMRPRLFSVDALDCLRVSSFKEDQLPQMVREVSYSLELPDDVHDDLDEEAVLLSVIRAPAIE